MSEEKSQALIIGAGGGIGAAMLARWAQEQRFDRVWAVSRRPAGDWERGSRVVPLLSDHSDADIAAQVSHILQNSSNLSRVVIAIGTLHGDTYQPEKALGRLREDALLEVYRVNCVLPLRWLAALGPLLRGADDCRVRCSAPASAASATTASAAGTATAAPRRHSTWV
jgi:NAD(P)-dependent dehydrogenase (short-subunit alcohol dehydrogenase family)